MSKFDKRLLQSPSGFPDLGPAEAIAQRRMLEVIRKHYELAGYVPIETPLVERPEVLGAKAEGEIRSQVYGLRLLNPNPDAADDTKGLALRFDQTVPLARFVAANHGTLQFPFRRYVIGPVFRGERPKDGRYRQFIQADIDAIGDGTISVLYDAEMVAVIAGIFTELAIGPFTIRIGHRKVLQGIFQSAGVTDEAAMGRALRVIDRLEKDGPAATRRSLAELGIAETSMGNLFALFSEDRTTDETLRYLAQAKNSNALYNEGVAELSEVVGAVRDLGVPENRFRVDLSIARGLDYYTGTVYETRFDEHPDIGSIASGGRYDDLVSTFSDRKFPGVGISIGVTRLLLRLIKAKLVPATATTLAQVLMTTPALATHRHEYLAQAAQLRDSGVPTEVYLQDRPLGKQLQFASRRGFSIAIIGTQEQLATGVIGVKNLATGEQTEVPLAELSSTVRGMLL